MTRACDTANCQQRAKKAPCCNARLCDACTDKHTHPELDAIALDPKKRREWLAANAPEEQLTTDAINELNKQPGLFVWRTKRKQGARAKSELDGVLDIGGIAAPDGRAVYVEMKRDHQDECACGSCAAQRNFALKVQGAGGVAVLGARTAQQAVDGVRMGLARVRGRSAA